MFYSDLVQLFSFILLMKCCGGTSVLQHPLGKASKAITSTAPFCNPFSPTAPYLLFKQPASDCLSWASLSPLQGLPARVTAFRWAKEVRWEDVCLVGGTETSQDRGFPEKEWVPALSSSILDYMSFLLKGHL